MWSKKQLKIIPSIKSQDKLNRQVPKNHINIKQPFDDIFNKSEQKYIKEAIDYCKFKF